MVWRYSSTSWISHSGVEAPAVTPTVLEILARYEIPATFYLATGFIGTGRVFWVDRLEYLVTEWRPAVEVPTWRQQAEKVDKVLREIC